MYAQGTDSWPCALMLGEHFGSGDGERETSITRQMPFEPLPASVLLNEFASLKRFGERGMGIWSERGLVGWRGMWCNALQ